LWSGRFDRFAGVVVALAKRYEEVKRLMTGRDATSFLRR
jgi:hypothetical protein